MPKKVSAARAKSFYIPGIQTLLTPRLQKKFALGFGICGIGLMGADLMITGSIFVHVAELMAASIGCFIVALLLDHRANRNKSAKSPD